MYLIRLKSYLLLLLFYLLISVFGKLNIRSKRYVAFPEGTTFIATLCLTNNILGRTENIFLDGINWGISYDLPNSSTIQEVFRSNNKFSYKRKQRRDLYNRIESVTEKMGFGGKSCIYRAMCDALRKFNNNKQIYVLQEIIRIFFTFPLENLSYLEPDEHRKYHWATRISLEKNYLKCKELFPDCTISIIDLVLGQSPDQP